MIMLIKRRKMNIIRRRKEIPEIERELTGTHWDKINSNGGDICFVCDRRIRHDQNVRYIGTNKYTGEKLYRHASCEAGSENWNKKFGGRLMTRLMSVGKKMESAIDDIKKIKAIVINKQQQQQEEVKIKITRRRRV